MPTLSSLDREPKCIIKILVILYSLLQGLIIKTLALFFLSFFGALACCEIVAKVVYFVSNDTRIKVSVGTTFGSVGGTQFYYCTVSNLGGPVSSLYV